MITSDERGVTTTGVFCMWVSGFHLSPILVFRGHDSTLVENLSSFRNRGTDFALFENGWSNRGFSEMAETFCCFC